MEKQARGLGVKDMLCRTIPKVNDGEWAQACSLIKINPRGGRAFLFYVSCAQHSHIEPLKTSKKMLEKNKIGRKLMFLLMGRSV